MSGEVFQNCSFLEDIKIEQTICSKLLKSNNTSAKLTFIKFSSQNSLWLQYINFHTNYIEVDFSFFIAIAQTQLI